MPNTKGNLDGKVTFLACAGSGIGRATALAFAREGANVVVADIVQRGNQGTVGWVRLVTTRVGGTGAAVGERQRWIAAQTRCIVLRAASTAGPGTICRINAAVALRLLRRPMYHMYSTRRVSMSTVSIVASSVDSQNVVAAKLLDAVVESVARSPDPGARSAVLSILVDEMCAAVSWFRGSDTTLNDAADVELASVRQLAAAAHDHHWRMSFLHACVEGEDAR